MIYLAMGRNGKTWTAISQTPYLKALDFIEWGSTWHGGGLFIDDQSYALSGSAIAEESRFLSGLKSMPMPQKFQERIKALGPSKRDECFAYNIYGSRLLRDGWQFESGAKITGDHTTRFLKPLAGPWQLRKCIGKLENMTRTDCEYHEIVHSETQEKTTLPDWEWADVAAGWVYWAEGGCLFKARTNRHTGKGEAKLIHDFNGYSFTERTAPY